MSDIIELINAIKLDPTCRTNPAAGLPAISMPLRLPDDVIRFYSLYGGATLFVDHEYPLTIVTASYGEKNDS